MSKLDYTSLNISESISAAEQLSLITLMMLDQRYHGEQLAECLQPLLLKLNDDLLTIRLLHSLNVESGTADSLSTVVNAI